MCLLITKPVTTKFDASFLNDVYKFNSDGIGVMYADGGEVIVKKVLPKTADEALAFYKEHIDSRECVVHYRMRTHGATDLNNCHPYQVLTAEEGYELWLMHNGVLHTGNASDVSMSDTWHYIQNYLRPILLHNPTFFMTNEFKDLIESHIGSGNKFTLLDALGNLVTINEDEGVRFEGAWLSNTYAWSSTGKNYTLCRPKYKATQYSYARSYNFAYDDDEFDRPGYRWGTSSAISAYERDLDDETMWVDAIEEVIDKTYTDTTDPMLHVSYTALYKFYDTVGSVAAWEFVAYAAESELSLEDIAHYIYMNPSELRELFGISAPKEQKESELL